MQSSDSRESVREVVVPGELLAISSKKAGVGTYSEGGKIFASQLGIKTVRPDSISVVPLAGQYIPVTGDLVVGKIVDVGASNWLVDINSPYPSPLHVNEVPWRVEFGETRKFMTVGDIVLLMIVGVDETKRIRVSMQEHGLRKLTGGTVMEVSPSKVPRVIGKNGSMIQMLKNMTSCRIYVGQNGRIWIDGELDSIVRAVQAIRMIEDEAHSQGLTEKVKALLERSSGTGA
ncbi:MAG: exosome complex RNA-binding protein Rrp4 [Thermoplasmata archaeon]|jgi:exosome complex component RRP4|nr:exosome complex RNA-binding protein Rrp4 [Thermoplasmata archaeon]